MANTHCKNCMFSNEANSTSPCEFNLIDLVKDNKELSVVDNFFYIKNYKCAYGFSENIYTENPELQNIPDIKTFIIDKAKLKYYLILDIRKLSDNSISNQINVIKTLDIKPSFISLICSNEQKANNIISNAKDEFKNSGIDWKVHVFVNSIPLNDCVNISAETTISNLQNISTILISDCSDDTLFLNDAVNYMHYSFRLIQNDSYCIMKNKNNLNMLAIYVSLYKSILSTVSKDILHGIDSIPELKIGTYVIKDSQ
jgi:hypothetical protein